MTNLSAKKIVLNIIWMLKLNRKDRVYIFIIKNCFQYDFFASSWNFVKCQNYFWKIKQKFFKIACSLLNVTLRIFLLLKLQTTISIAAIIVSLIATLLILFYNFMNCYIRGSQYCAKILLYFHIFQCRDRYISVKLITNLINPTHNFVTCASLLAAQ